MVHFNSDDIKVLCLYRVDKVLTVKVVDFGLARDAYISDYYRIQSNNKLPVKWMAPEALHDQISSEKTDVVSLNLSPVTKLYVKYSGHMGLLVGKCSVLVVYLTQLCPTMRY